MLALAAQGVTKIFTRGGAQVVAVNNASLEVDGGEVVALMGPSGSGKTTLLRALSLIDPPTTGRIIIDGETVYGDGRVLVDDRRLRRQKVGVVFQAYNLIPFLSAAENVALILALNGVSNREALHRARLLLERLQLLPRADTLVGEGLRL